ncbi:MAG: hypothetical protein HKL84_01290 [Acidimicrobiaceae bacterium]|nr:hypothetical protein [Acidimicrobiaceae bacterium]
MYSDTTLIRQEYGVYKETSASIEVPRVRVPRTRTRLTHVILTLTIVIATLFEVRSWQTTPRPYASAPTSCRVTQPPRATSSITSATALQAAVSSYNALEMCFGGPRGSFNGPYVGLAAAWPESQALTALLGLSVLGGTPATLRSDIAQQMSVLSNYWDPKGGYFPIGRWYSTGRGVKKYDDNAWLGLDLVDAYLITRNSVYLNQARAVATFETTGWSTNTHFASPGGLYWQEPAYGKHRNAVSTGGAALLNARLYAITGLRIYRNRAEQYLRWTVSTLTLHNGLIGDQISIGGVVNRKIWSYNQGLVIATYTSLYRTTKNQSYLTAATLLAQRSLSYLTARRRLEQQPEIFNAIYFRSMANLNAVTRQLGYVHTLQSYATYLYDRMVPSTGVVHLGPMTTVATGWLLTQAAATQIFTLYASTAVRALNA